jgi:hypothetical protein
MVSPEVENSGSENAYIDTPEFLDRVECDNFLQQIIPVVTLTENVSKCQQR